MPARRRRIVSQSTAVQRLRLTYSQGAEVKYVGHLDMLRAWERLLRRAALPMAYSHGFNPRPRMVFAAPLPVGFTSAQEVVDVFLETRVDVQDAARRLAEQMPWGIRLQRVEEVALDLPPLPNEVVAIEYAVTVRPAGARDEMRARIDELLRSEHWPMKRGAQHKSREYDLRTLIRSLVVQEEDDRMILTMQLLAGQQGTGRPDQVVEAIGVGCAVESIHRVRLLCGEPQHRTGASGEECLSRGEAT